MNADPISWKVIAGWAGAVIALLASGFAIMLGRQVSQFQETAEDHEQRLQELEKDNAVIHEALKNGARERHAIRKAIEANGKKIDKLKDDLTSAVIEAVKKD